MPRGSITGGGGGGGREVTDKRESYKMGCATREIRGEGTTRARGTKVPGRCPSMPVGHPDGAGTRGTDANAILQLSTGRRKKSREERWRKERGEAGREGLGLICQISFHASESGRDQHDGAR